MSYSKVYLHDRLVEYTIVDVVLIVQNRFLLFPIYILLTSESIVAIFTKTGQTTLETITQRLLCLKLFKEVILTKPHQNIEIPQNSL